MKQGGSTLLRHITFVVFLLSKVKSNREMEDLPRLLIVSFDGFSPSYLNKNITPHLNQIRNEGTTSEYLRNCFPTKTFPNHHSIATGLWPAEHGVVGTQIFDLDLGKLSYSRELYEYKDDVQTIWTINESNGGKSGCIMWPGSEFSYTKDRINCSFIEYFNMSIPWEHRLEKTIEFFEAGANLVLLYIEEPDFWGHMIGINAHKIDELLQKIDNFVESIIEKTKRFSKLNYIFLSDHGMINTNPGKFINLSQILPQHKEHIYGVSPVMQISPVNVDEIYRFLINASVETGAFKVYKNKDLPERWNYNNARRTGPLTVVAEPHYAFDDIWQNIEEYNKHYNISYTNESEYGIHGYDNQLRSMNSFFIAKGPQIKTHHVVQPFDTVDLFHLFCEILEIPPPNVSGNRNNILDILVSHVPSNTVMSTSMIILIIGSSMLMISSFTIALLVQRHKRNSQIVPPYIYEEHEPEHEEQKLLEINTHNLPDLKV